jgi:hypothetical protein
MSMETYFAILAVIACLAIVAMGRALERVHTLEETIRRYQLACNQASRWLIPSPAAMNTAKWISDNGEGLSTIDIHRHARVMNTRRSR